MDPWKSWAIVGVVGAGAAYYYTQSGKIKRGRGRSIATLADQNQRRESDIRNDSKDVRKKKGKAKASDASDQVTSDAADVSSASIQTIPSERSKKRKGGKQQPSKLAQSSAVEVSKERELGFGDGKEDEGMSNVDFAKQLSLLKSGSSLKKPITIDEHKKTKKQGKRNELPPETSNGSTSKVDGISSSQNMSTASSTTGADADDDLSMPVSPEFGATQATTPSGLDVSDMLEPPAKGLSTLRLTEPVNPQAVKQPKQHYAAPQPETKKQRQNRQKNEEKKAMREQAEKERRVLLDKQLRTAREAEGRPAKNGLGPSKPPTTKAWSNPTNATPGSTLSPSRPNDEALLDTFEESTSITNSNINDANGSTRITPADGKGWSNDFPSEEEQLRLINEMDGGNAWSTVSSGKAKKKSAVAGTAAGTINNNNVESSGSKKPSSNNLAPSFTHSQTSLNDNKNKDGISSSGTNTPAVSSNAVGSSMANMSLGANGPVKPKETLAMEIPHPPGISDAAYANMLEIAYAYQFNEYEDYLADWKKTKWSDGRLRSQDENQDITIRTKMTSTGKKRAIKKRPRRPKANHETLDKIVWNFDNIHEHPDYDPLWPYALTGHPNDSNWEGGHMRGFYHVYLKYRDYYSSEEYSTDEEDSTDKASMPHEFANKESIDKN